MSASRLQRLAAIYLATLYGVVGLTGQSMHYLATDAFGIWTARGSVADSGYYHVHAPDFHGHYHKHSHHGAHSHAGMGVCSTEDQTNPSDRLTSKGSSHRPHTCPALALISTLKLSQVATNHFSLILDSFPTPSCEVRRISGYEVARYVSPRGPPSDNVA